MAHDGWPLIQAPGGPPGLLKTTALFQNKARSVRHGHRLFIVRASEGREKKRSKSLGDQLLDYIEGGPKLRKWYGAEEELPRDGGVAAKGAPGGEEDEGAGGDAVRDAVLVTDADSETGQLIVLQLILKRRRVVALVRDVRAARAAFGPYVEPVAGDVTNAESVRRALRTATSVICAGRVGVVPEIMRECGGDHLVLLSKAGAGGKRAATGLGGLLGGFGLKQVEQDEACAASAGVPYTIVRAGRLMDAPGGLGLVFSQAQGGAAADGSITREDAAAVCVRAVESPPQRALVFEVVNAKEGSDKRQDAADDFALLRETEAAAL